MRHTTLRSGDVIFSFPNDADSQLFMRHKARLLKSLPAPTRIIALYHRFKSPTTTAPNPEANRGWRPSPRTMRPSTPAPCPVPASHLSPPWHRSLVARPSPAAPPSLPTPTGAGAPVAAPRTRPAERGETLWDQPTRRLPRSRAATGPRQGQEGEATPTAQTSPTAHTPASPPGLGAPDVPASGAAPSERLAAPATLLLPVPQPGSGPGMMTVPQRHAGQAHGTGWGGEDDEDDEEKEETYQREEKEDRPRAQCQQQPQHQPQSRTVDPSVLPGWDTYGLPPSERRTTALAPMDVDNPNKRKQRASSDDADDAIDADASQTPEEAPLLLPEAAPEPQPSPPQAGEEPEPEEPEDDGPQQTVTAPPPCRTGPTRGMRTRTSRTRRATSSPSTTRPRTTRTTRTPRTRGTRRRRTRHGSRSTSAISLNAHPTKAHTA